MALPFTRLKTSLEEMGIQVDTADYLFNNLNEFKNEKIIYWSFGNTDNIHLLSELNSLLFSTLIIFEPPLITPNIYKNLHDISKNFNQIYLHNTTGDGYDLSNLEISKLNKLFVPQPYMDVISDYWSNERRLDKVVIVAGNHNPFFRKPELYSLRLKFVRYFSKFDDYIHLYGFNWLKLFSRNSLNYNYLRSLKSIYKAYKGACENKHLLLSKYKFSLCTENTVVDGYITEKIFDCFYAGTVPIYLGPKNVDDFIPKNSYISIDDFNSFEELRSYLKNLTDAQYNHYRVAGREFLIKNHSSYTNSLVNIFNNGYNLL